MKASRIKGLVTVLAFAFAGAAYAELVNFTASIDGAQAGTNSPATGSATATLDTDTLEMTWNITWTPLQGTITQAHFHGPAVPGQNAGIQVNFGAISGLVSPSIGSATITQAQANDLLAELYYVNIHSTVSPAGEIRGQVLVAPADDDQDGVPNDEDNCPNAANEDQENSDEDTHGDACDNCTLATNEDQRDVDADSIGSLCDGDFDQNCNVDFTDLGQMKAGFFGTDPNLNMNGIGNVDFADLGLLKQGFFMPPGPSGVPNDCPP